MPTTEHAEHTEYALRKGNQTRSAVNTRTSEGPAERKAASVARNAAARAAAAPPAADWVTIDGLQVSYGETNVLEGVSFGIPRGSLVAVLGPSGCGKTTLLRAVAGLLPAGAGTIRVGERVVSSPTVQLAPEKRGMGWVPQDASLFPHLTVGQNIGFGLPRGSRIGGREARAARIGELVDLVGLSGLVDRSPAQLSGGQAQRVSLARALAARPNLMLLDEPFAALDPLLRAALRIEVAALLRDQNSTSLLVTHDQEEALSLADYIAVMRGGRLLQWGTPAEVYEHPVSRWVAGFVGDTVELDGRWVGTGTEIAAAATGRVDCALGVVPARAFGAVPADGTAVRLMLRPEWLHLSPAITRVIARGALADVVPMDAAATGSGPVPVDAVATGSGPVPVDAAATGSGPVPMDAAATGSVTVERAEALARPRARQLPGLGVAPAGTEPVVGLVTAIAYAGHDALVSVELPGGTVVRARVAAPDLPQRGDRVRVSIRRPALAYPLD